MVEESSAVLLVIIFVFFCFSGFFFDQDWHNFKYFCLLWSASTKGQVRARVILRFAETVAVTFAVACRFVFLLLLHPCRQ